MVNGLQAEWVPPMLERAMKRAGYTSIKRLADEIDADVSHLRRIYTYQSNANLRVVLDMLKELGYECSSPEFILINELLEQNPLRDGGQSSIISKPNVNHIYVTLISHLVTNGPRTNGSASKRNNDHEVRPLEQDASSSAA